MFEHNSPGTPFSGNRILRGVFLLILTPFLVGIPFIPAGPREAKLFLGLEAVVILLFLGLLAPQRMAWCWRALAGIIGAAFTVYFIYEAGFSGHSWEITAFSPDPSPPKALRGFLFIGLPCLGYFFFGRRPGEQ